MYAVKIRQYTLPSNVCTQAVGSKGLALSEKIQDGNSDMATHTKQEE